MKISNSNIESPARRLAEFVRVLFDRLQLLAWPREKKLPKIPDFDVEQDKLVRQQTSTRTYRRVKIYLNHKTSTRVYVQYDPACPWLAPAKITLIADGEKGLSRSELQSIARAFGKTRLLIVELAFDFSSDCMVDRAFVRVHALFGKSHPVGGNLTPL
jgi:hypothetical protein